MTDTPAAKRKRHEDHYARQTGEPSSEISSEDRVLTSPAQAGKAASKTGPIPTGTTRLNLLDIQSRQRETRDEIHGNISMEPALTAIVDTPYFQRLRQVRQLGATSYVYMNATHTRYEHSFGVAHLAQLQVESLQQQQPALNITDKEVLLVKMAGLCHDMGHGPYSHTFEGHLHSQGFSHVKHEELSLVLLDAALRSRGLAVDMNRLDAPLQEVATERVGIHAPTFGLIKNRFQEDHDLSLTENVITSRDIVFVKECILGEPLPGCMDFIGRPDEKEYLYDIVNNRHSGKDVDKDDYYIRDAIRTMGEGRMDMLLINSARVTKIQCKVQNCFRCAARRGRRSSLEPGIHLSLAYPKKYATTVIKFFERRQELHSMIYTHKTQKAIEYMLCDILAASEKFYRIKLPDGQSFSISEATQNPEAYLKLTDRVIDRIEENDSEELKEARAIIQRLAWRDLYKFVYSKRLNEGTQGHIWNMKDSDIHNEMMEIVYECENTAAEENESSLFIEMEEEDEEDDAITASIGKLKGRDFIVEVRTIHKGKKEENPMNYVSFFDSHQDERQLARGPLDLPMASQAMEEEYAIRNTKSYIDKTVRIYSRLSELDDDYLEKNKAIEELFKRWFSGKGGDSAFPSLSQC